MRTLTLFLCLFQFTVLHCCAQSISHSTKQSSTLPFKITKKTPSGDGSPFVPASFPIGPFTKSTSNPVFGPLVSSPFESKYAYNPTNIVVNSTIFMLYRAQNASLQSSIGLAWSTDGTTFTRLNRPVIYSTEPWEKGGGCEDPRIVRVNGTFYVTYTGYDLQTPRLVMAHSNDLLNWKKVPPLFPGWLDVAPSENPGEVTTVLARLDHSKSAAIIDEKLDDGLYHMIFGDAFFYHAISPDMIHWTPSPPPQTPKKYNQAPPYAIPKNQWENLLVEAGPGPVKTKDGKWLLVYNGATAGIPIDGYKSVQYSSGQMLIDPAGLTSPGMPDTDLKPRAEGEVLTPDPATPFHYPHDHPPPRHLHDASRFEATESRPPKLQSREPNNKKELPKPLQVSSKSPFGPLSRLQSPFLEVTSPEERNGQTANVIFSEGIVQFKGKWYVYFGQADTTVGVATADIR